METVSAEDAETHTGVLTHISNLKMTYVGNLSENRSTFYFFFIFFFNNNDLKPA